MKSYTAVLFFVIITLSNIYSQFPMAEMDPVTWSFSKTDMGEGKYELRFTAEIDEPWHVYAIKQEQTGPIPTSFTFTVPEGVKLEGELTELTKAVVKFDEGFRFDVGAYYNKAEFLQKVSVSGSGELNLQGSVEYQCCNDETCLPPFSKEFNFRLKGPGSIDSQTTVISEPVQEQQEETRIKTEIDETTGEILSQEESTAEPVISEKPMTEDTDASRDRSMFGFFLITFLLGLAAILTPCVYPMIPMTISFFMRGEQKKSLVILKGIIFGLSMILVYTGLGVLVALTGLDANFGNVISTHWIPNTIFFVLFMIFALSFLGMFEIVLPSGFVNRVDRQADRGGLIGPFFMGITTVLVSFSCTGPIVGSLLTEAAGGAAIKPILGMFFFSLAFALPFTLLAIFPSMMKSLPKSGGWMNTVKVVLGFLMAAFGMKFLSSMDQSYHLGIFSREIYLAIWFVMAVILGFYLLGKIKFSNDSELTHITVPRLILAMTSFVFAIYVFTGIFGNDLKAISSVIPPKSAQSFSVTGSGGDQHDTYDQSGTYSGPGRYSDIFHLPYGILGYFNYEDGMKVAKEKNKPVFIDFTGHSCSNCKQMEGQVWSDPGVLKRLKEDYVVISLYTDDKTKLPEEEWITAEDGKVLKTIGEQNVYFELKNFNTFATPWYVLQDPDGNLLAEPIGKEMDIQKFIDFLDSGLEKM